MINRLYRILMLTGACFALAALPVDLARAQTSLETVGSAEALEALISCDPEVDRCSSGDDSDEVIVTGTRIAASRSITNNQQAGVDEGDLVKLRDNTLIVLRRGRLFTLSIEGGGIRPVDSINAFPPGVDPDDDWYDEILVFGDRVVVIGYSYERGGTEVNRFRVDTAGKLRFEDSHHLSSDDYFSSRNYASRLVGSQLVLYAPLYVGDAGNVEDALPTIQTWLGEDRPPVKRQLIRPEDIYVAPGIRARGHIAVEAVHSVIRCDLDAPTLTCQASAVLGPSSRTLYVAPTAVYLWLSRGRWPISNGGQTETDMSSLYRFPLNGDAPTAIATRGGPIDQFSFRENDAADALDVMVVSGSSGDAMWGPEVAEGGVALLHLPLTAFTDGSTAAPDAAYRLLPPLPDGGYGNQNRFVGDYLLYSGADVPIDQHDDWAFEDAIGVLNVVPLDGAPTRTFVTDGPFGRIEQMGQDALVVSGEEAVTFTTVALGEEPWISDRYVMAAAEEAETRSHAFFFRPDPESADGSSGVLGLPVMREAFAEDGEPELFESAADMAFLRRDTGRLRPLGTLDSRPDHTLYDGCRVSCVDWYGNARPIFAGDRIFALLGYELVEGRESRGRIREIGRVSFAPPPPEGPRPYYGN